MTAPDDLDGTDMGPEDDLQGVVEETKNGLAGDDSDDSDDDGYESQTVPELKAEVDRRNDDGAEIEVGGNGNKADLIEALEADDDK